MSLAPSPNAPIGPLTTCDRCGALGKVRYVLTNGTDLVFCGHHSREHQGSLTTLPLVRIDILERSTP